MALIGWDGYGGAFVGTSAAVRRVVERVGAAASNAAPCLLVGEVGTAKLGTARAIHDHGARRGGPFVVVQCAILPPNLIDSALFGHRAGAFIGAFEHHVGEVDRAAGGTLVLHGVDRLPLAVQAGLVERLDSEWRDSRPAGGVATDSRLIATTHRDLADAVVAGTFRSDLLSRLSRSMIRLPSLRDRRDDIPMLVWYTVRCWAARLDKTIQSVPEATMEALVEYEWPGDVEELEQVVGRGVRVATHGVLAIDEAWLRGAACCGELATGAASDRLEDVERAHIERVLGRCGWRVKGHDGAAERLGLHPSTLYSRMKKLGIGNARSRV